MRPMIQPSLLFPVQGRRKRTRVELVQHVLEALALDGPLITSHVTGRTLIGPSVVKKILGSLRDHGLVQEEETVMASGRRGPSYTLTDRGQDFLGSLEFVVEVCRR